MLSVSHINKQPHAVPSKAVLPTLQRLIAKNCKKIATLEERVQQLKIQLKLHRGDPELIKRLTKTKHLILLMSLKQRQRKSAVGALITQNKHLYVKSVNHPNAIKRSLWVLKFTNPVTPKTTLTELQSEIDKTSNAITALSLVDPTIANTIRQPLVSRVNELKTELKTMLNAQRVCKFYGSK